VSVIGMTNLPEARLVREAGMSYATLALATDYDCWHEEEEHVSVEAVIAILKKNVAVAQEVIRGVAERLATPESPKQSPYSEAAATATMTAHEAIPVEARRRLQAIVGEYLG
jgi:5'-methylthioadenosine phosphorylase